MAGKTEMLKSENICVLRQHNICAQEVFNAFYNGNTNILYVTDKDGYFLGIITNKSFFEQLMNHADEIRIMENCSVVRECGNMEAVFVAAKELFEKFGITTAIPVLDENRRVLYEIRKNIEVTDNYLVEEFHKKIANYEKSRYLSNEIASLREILERQDMLVIGSEDRFDKVFGKLLKNKQRITFVSSPDNPYEFMMNNEKLLIDMSYEEVVGRNEIYDFANNGYSVRAFINSVIHIIETEKCRRLYRSMTNEVFTLNDFLEGEKEIVLSSTGIFNFEIKNYLHEQGIETRNDIDIMRLFYVTLVRNGLMIKRAFNRLGDIFEHINLIYQYYLINKRLGKKVQILNFCFDSELEPSDYEKEMADTVCRERRFDMRAIAGLKSFYSVGDKTDEDIEKVLKAVEDLVMKQTRNFENNLVVFKDTKSELYNVENGIRKTLYQPNEYYATVYFIGVCTIFGASCEDSYTIPSIIQRYVNQSGKKYRMVNLGNIYFEADNLIEKLNISENDIFVMVFPYISKKVKDLIPVIEMGEMFNRIRMEKYHGMDCFYDGQVLHCADNGNLIYADIIYAELKKYLKGSNEEELRKGSIYHIFKKDYTDLDILYDYNDYRKELQYVRRVHEENSNKKRIGCIVMNCNPFTSGHRYLVEFAQRVTDFLYIFVVEENKSFFSYSDRFEMVKRGVQDLDNIAVVRSGRMIISQATFSTYFAKEAISVTADVSCNTDLRVFAQYIAPELDIRYRFVGEEPSDVVTAEYNQAMKEILPEFGIEVVEIPRKKCNEGVISASMVRKYYQNNDFDKLKEIVPKTTLEYLKDLYKAATLQ